MKIVSAEIATSVDAGSLVFAPIADGGQALTTSSVRLRFDRFLNPATVSRQSFCLRGSPDEVLTLGDCANGVFLEPAYDPVRREVVLRLPSGERLAPDTTYRLTTFLAVESGTCPQTLRACGVRAFDGAPLFDQYSFTFSTVAVDPPSAPEDTTPTADACAAFTTLRNNCGFAPCHGPGTGVGPVVGLDLSSLDGIDATARNHVAHQAQMGENADDPDRTALRFGRAMPLLDAFNPGEAGNPGNSYLLYKVLVGPSRKLLSADAALSADEIARVRASIVVGMPMPPSDFASLAPTEDALVNLSLWISQGAPLEACP